MRIFAVRDSTTAESLRLDFSLDIKEIARTMQEGNPLQGCCTVSQTYPARPGDLTTSSTMATITPKLYPQCLMPKLRSQYESMTERKK